MTTSPPAPALGQLIGQASTAASLLFDPLLAAHDLEFDVWVTLNTLILAGEPMPVVALAGRVADLRNSTAEQAQPWIDASVSRGVISTDRGAAEVTATGRKLHASMTAGIQELSRRLTGDLPPADLDATRRVLTTYTERARAAAAH